MRSFASLRMTRGGLRGIARGVPASLRDRGSVRSAPDGCAPNNTLFFLQRETLPDEMEDVTLAGFGQPQESLAAEQSRRAARIEKGLESADRKRPITLEGQRGDACTLQMS